MARYLRRCSPDSRPINPELLAAYLDYIPPSLQSVPCWSHKCLSRSVPHYPGRCVITLDCGKDQIQGLRRRVTVEMRFHPRDPNDPKRLVFREAQKVTSKRSVEFYEEYVAKKSELWSAKMKSYFGEDAEVDLIPYIISIYGLSLDSSLPGLQHDSERREISFNGEAMLQDFIAEHTEMYQKLLAIDSVGWTLKKEAMLQKYRNDRGYSKVFEEWARIKTKALKEVRRERIRRLYRERPGEQSQVARIHRKHEMKQIERIQLAECDGIGREKEHDCTSQAVTNVEQIVRDEEGGGEGNTQDGGDPLENGGGNDGAAESDGHDDGTH